MGEDRRGAGAFEACVTAALILFVKIFDKIRPYFVEKFADDKIFDKINTFFVEILDEIPQGLSGRQTISSPPLRFHPMSDGPCKISTFFRIFKINFNLFGNYIGHFQPKSLFFPKKVESHQSGSL